LVQSGTTQNKNRPHQPTIKFAGFLPIWMLHPPRSCENRRGTTKNKLIGRKNKLRIYLLYTHQGLVKIDKEQQKIKIVRTNQQSSLLGSCQSIFSLSKVLGLEKCWDKGARGYQRSTKVLPM